MQESTYIIPRYAASIISSLRHCNSLLGVLAASSFLSFYIPIYSHPNDPSVTQIALNLFKTIQRVLACKAKSKLLGMTGFPLHDFVQLGSPTLIPGIQSSPDLGANLFLCNTLPKPMANLLSS